MIRLVREVAGVEPRFLMAENEFVTILPRVLGPKRS